ncbi:MAG: TetR/AcrR family transcriptional regulator [Jatrophihabitans sp.]|uniref:TetR/AcrR family transcriptional regulator n=1 Tax=Jatrophihabitans sp. TaxID=1932789 RepID=UPI003F7FD6C8
MATAPSRRDLIGRAALDVLAEAGVRGLTHRAVDQAAGLPSGSVNYYHPSRAALLDAAVDALIEQDDAAAAAAQKRSGLPSKNIADAAKGLAEYVAALSAAKVRPLVRARAELLTEAQRRPEVATKLRTSRTAALAFATSVLEGLGRKDAAKQADVLVTVLDGLVQRQVLVGPKALPRPQVEQVLKAVLQAV